MRALVIQEPGKVSVEERSLPPLRPDYMRIQTKAFALNPTDSKHVDGNGPKGSIIGCDYSGIVEEVGADCKGGLKPGDKIAGMCHGGNTNDFNSGAFGEYCLQKDQICMKIPEGMSFEEAASIGVGVSTVGQGLYQSLKLPLPTNPAEQPFWLLIYGGSTATGTLAIQYAKLSGLKIVTICSPKHNQLMKELGADAVFDYKDEQCGQKIREYTEDSLEYVFDTITSESSMEICAAALSSDKTKNLRYSALLVVKKFPREEVKANFTLGYTIFGETFDKFGNHWPGQSDHYEHGKMFWNMSEKLFAEGKIKPHPVEVHEEGLEGIIKGLDRFREGSVSGVKLVYK